MCIRDRSSNKQITPAAYVIYRGHNVFDTAGGGRRVKYAQRYTIVITVANASSQIEADNIIADSNEIINKTVQVVLAYKSSYFQPFKPVGSDTAGFDNSFSYFPFTFETILTL